MSHQLQKNKRTVVDFYDMMFNQSKPMEAVRAIRRQGIRSSTIRRVADGKDGFIAYFSKMAKDYPGKSVQFKRVIAEGNFVVLHTHQKWPGSVGLGGDRYFSPGRGREDRRALGRAADRSRRNRRIPIRCFDRRQRRAPPLRDAALDQGDQAVQDQDRPRRTAGDAKIDRHHVLHRPDAGIASLEEAAGAGAVAERDNPFRIGCRVDRCAPAPFSYWP